MHAVCRKCLRSECACMKICDWRVPQSVSITITPEGEDPSTASHSGFPAWSWFEANCRRNVNYPDQFDFPVQRDFYFRFYQLINQGQPWALATDGPNALVIGYLPFTSGPRVGGTSGLGNPPASVGRYTPGIFPGLQECSPGDYGEILSFFWYQGADGALPPAYYLIQRCSGETSNGYGMFSTVAGCWKPNLRHPDICIPQPYHGQTLNGVHWSIDVTL